MMIKTLRVVRTSPLVLPPLQLGEKFVCEGFPAPTPRLNGVEVDPVPRLDLRNEYICNLELLRTTDQPAVRTIFGDQEPYAAPGKLSALALPLNDSPPRPRSVDDLGRTIDDEAGSAHSSLLSPSDIDPADMADSPEDIDERSDGTMSEPESSVGGSFQHVGPSSSCGSDDSSSFSDDLIPTTLSSEAVSDSRAVEDMISLSPFGVLRTAVRS